MRKTYLPHPDRFAPSAATAVRPFDDDRPLNDGRLRRAVEPRPAAVMARRRWRAPVRRRRRRHRPAWARAQHLHDSADDGPGDLYAVARSPVPCFGPECPGGKHSRQQHDCSYRLLLFEWLSGSVSDRTTQDITIIRNLILYWFCKYFSFFLVPAGGRRIDAVCSAGYFINGKEK